MKLKYLPWTVFALFALAIGFYPLTYYISAKPNPNYFSSKTPQLLANQVWHTALYIHITLAGIAMVTGWTQFIRNIRERYLNFHRSLGKIYVFSVIISSIAGMYISLFATGGIIVTLGFGCSEFRGSLPSPKPIQYP